MQFPCDGLTLLKVFFQLIFVSLVSLGLFANRIQMYIQIPVNHTSKMKRFANILNAKNPFIFAKRPIVGV